MSRPRGPHAPGSTAQCPGVDPHPPAVRPPARRSRAHRRHAAGPGVRRRRAPHAARRSSRSLRRSDRGARGTAAPGARRPSACCSRSSHLGADRVSGIWTSLDDLAEDEAVVAALRSVDDVARGRAEPPARRPDWFATSLVRRRRGVGRRPAGPAGPTPDRAGGADEGVEHVGGAQDPVRSRPGLVQGVVPSLPRRAGPDPARGRDAARGALPPSWPPTTRAGGPSPSTSPVPTRRTCPTTSVRPRPGSPRLCS